MSATHDSHEPDPIGTAEPAAPRLDPRDDRDGEPRLDGDGLDPSFTAAATKVFRRYREMLKRLA